MNFYDVIRNRRSIRGFQSTPVPDEAISRIAAAVNAAPSACNRQPFTVKLVRNAEVRSALAACCKQDFPATAPAILAVISDPEAAWSRGDGFNSADTDMAIAMEHAILAATAEGLGSCWVCAFDPVEAARVLDVASPCRVAALCPIGYPAVSPCAFTRKAESQIFEVID